jgi:hypothetical protein
MISKLAVRGRIPLVISKTRRTPTKGYFFKYLLSTIVVHFAKFEPIIAFNSFFAHKLRILCCIPECFGGHYRVNGAGHALPG